MGVSGAIRFLAGNYQKQSKTGHQRAIWGHKGLTKVLEKWPGCRLQRCTEHKRANLLQHCPAHARRELRRDYNRVVYAKNGIDARKAYDELVAKWTPLAPAVVRSLEEAVISC